MKKLIIFLGIVSLVFVLCACSGPSKDTVTSETAQSWELEDGVLTVSYSGDMNDLSDGYYMPWYDESSNIMKIVVEDGVTSIADRAFCYCSSLEEVEIANSVISIGAEAFEGCSDLTAVSIPKGVSTIGDYAFAECVSLADVEIADSVTTIGDYAFTDCGGIIEINIPGSVNSIGCGVFSGCVELENIYVGDNSSYAAVDGVLYNKDITELVSCPGKKSEVSIPESVITIGEDAFGFCEMLTDIIIPGNVTTIEDYAFEGCDSLIEITIPESVTSIGESAFIWCDSLADILYEGSKSEWSNISIGEYNDSLTEAEIHYNSDIAGADLSGGNGEEDVTSTTDDLSWELEDGVLTISGTGDMNSLIEGDDTMFDEMPWHDEAANITKVVIEEGVTSIGKEAFSCCELLTEVEIPETVVSIDEEAFYYCLALTEIEIPASVTEIGDSAFFWCDSLSDVYFDGSESEWNSVNIADYNDGLANAEIHYSSK